MVFKWFLNGLTIKKKAFKKLHKNLDVKGF